MKENYFKKVIKIVLCIAIMQTLIIGFNSSIFNVCIYAKNPTWAQIKNSSTYLYKSAELNSSINNKWCLIENTYFVKILNNYNSEYYKVEYNGINGFVKKSEICLINETPLMPYPNNTTFSVGKTNCYMRSKPQIKDNTDNTICVVPANTTGLKYIGKTIGEEAIDFKGSVWYLAEYNGYVGYIYSAYTTSITPIKENVETVSLFIGNDFSKINPLTNTTCVILIIVTLIPCLIILFMLYKPNNKKVKARINTKKLKNTITYFDENL